MIAPKAVGMRLAGSEMGAQQEAAHVWPVPAAGSGGAQLRLPPCRCLHHRGHYEALVPVPVVFLMLPVVVLFALYPGLFTLSRLGR